MAAAVKNYAYEVEVKDGKRIMAQSPVNKAFLDDCKKVAEKYRKSNGNLSAISLSSDKW